MNPVSLGETKGYRRSCVFSAQRSTGIQVDRYLTLNRLDLRSTASDVLLVLYRPMQRWLRRPSPEAITVRMASQN